MQTDAASPPPVVRSTGQNPKIENVFRDRKGFPVLTEAGYGPVKRLFQAGFSGSGRFGQMTSRACSVQPRRPGIAENRQIGIPIDRFERVERRGQAGQRQLLVTLPIGSLEPVTKMLDREAQNQP